MEKFDPRYIPNLEERAVMSWYRRYPYGDEKYKDAQIDGYIAGAQEQGERDRVVIRMLIDELQTSRLYHLGITGLDSDAEITRKEKEGDCALVRSIDSVINYAKEAIGDGKGNKK